MDLNSILISEFAKITNDNKETINYEELSDEELERILKENE